MLVHILLFYGYVVWWGMFTGIVGYCYRYMIDEDLTVLNLTVKHFFYHHVHYV